VHDTVETSWPGFTKCHSLHGAILLLPAEATAATGGQYLALSKAWQSCFCFVAELHILRK